MFGVVRHASERQRARASVLALGHSTNCLFTITGVPFAQAEASFLLSCVPETTLPPKQHYRAFRRKNIVPVGRVKVDPA